MISRRADGERSSAPILDRGGHAPGPRRTGPVCAAAPQSHRGPPGQKGPPQKENWYTQRPPIHLYRSFGVDCPSGQLQVSPVVTFLMVFSVQQAAQEMGSWLSHWT